MALAFKFPYLDAHLKIKYQYKISAKENIVLKILFLEPWYGGSHQDVALGFKAHSRHDICLVTLPDRFWKWRMRGAALYFANQVENISDYDVVLATDMMDLTDFKALMGNNIPPVVLYFHENQLSYPLASGQKRDFHLGFTNIISAFAADRVLFNSQFHLDEFIQAAERLVKHMPDFRPRWMMEKIKEKASVVYPGCRFATKPFEVGKEDVTPPLIVWNHRWEFDKKPEEFFEILEGIKEKGIDFSLAVLGESLDLHPEVFDIAREKFKDEIRVFGYAESRSEYLSWLKKGSVVISCAIQENFGISIVEAVRHGCLPLLPARLSYPEIMPKAFHDKIIYGSKEELTTKLEYALLNPQKHLDIRQALSNEMEKFAWDVMAKQYDAILDSLF